MKVPPVKPTGPVFTASQLKILYKSGKLPSIKHGIYGDTLSKKNVTDEHIIPRSWGGSKYGETNLALATSRSNTARSNYPISEFLTEEDLLQYMEEISEIDPKVFNKDKYLEGLLRNIKRAYEMEQDQKLMRKFHVII